MVAYCREREEGGCSGCWSSWILDVPGERRDTSRWVRGSDLKKSTGPGGSGVGVPRATGDEPTVRLPAGTVFTVDSEVASVGPGPPKPASGWGYGDGKEWQAWRKREVREEGGRKPNPKLSMASLLRGPWEIGAQGRNGWDKSISNALSRCNVTKAWICSCSLSPLPPACPLPLLPSLWGPKLSYQISPVCLVSHKISASANSSSLDCSNSLLDFASKSGPSNSVARVVPSKQNNQKKVPTKGHW